MGLFSLFTIGATSVNDTSTPSDFRAFLTWWGRLTSPKERQDKRLVNFIKVIENPAATMVSGSSVLAYRQNKKPFGNDIDIFINIVLMYWSNESMFSYNILNESIGEALYFLIVLSNNFQNIFILSITIATKCEDGPNYPYYSKRHEKYCHKGEYHKKKNQQSYYFNFH